MHHLRDCILDYSKHQCLNHNYLNSGIPKSFLDEEDQTIYDYEPHCDGYGYYYQPEMNPFNDAFGERWYYSRDEKSGSTDKITRISVKNCEQLLHLARLISEKGEGEDGTNQKLARAFRDVYMSPIESGEEEFGDEMDDKIQVKLLSVMCSTEVLEMECCEFEPPPHEDKSISASFLSIFYIFPNLRALKVNYMSSNPEYNRNISLFASFPVPTDYADVNDDAHLVSDKLEILSFNHCANFHAADLPYLIDCAIEHKVFPNLRHLQIRYSSGMSYSSVSLAADVFNLDFDRWECSGWCWPQDPVNSKNFHIHV